MLGAVSAMKGPTVYRVMLAVVAVASFVAVALLVIGIVLGSANEIGSLLIHYGGILAPISFVLLILAVAWGRRSRQPGDSKSEP